MNFSVRIYFLLAVQLVTQVAAFTSSGSSISVGAWNTITNVRNGSTYRNHASSQPIDGDGDGDGSSFPWRVVMDIGREPLARMPFGWARQGARMPLAVSTDFCAGGDRTNGNGHRNSARVVPHADTVGFTGPEGAVESPIVGGDWKLSEDSTVLTFSYTVAQELRRRDVTIEAGTELVLSTKIYTQTELDRLNKEFYDAREELWESGGELNDVLDRQGASKKWNAETDQWERRYPNENPFNFVSKQISYWGAKVKQSQTKNQRPEMETLSDPGGKIPGVGGGGNVYLAKEGVIRYDGEKGPVCGLWTAQPITNVPAWDRGK